MSKMGALFLEDQEKNPHLVDQQLTLEPDDEWTDESVDLEPDHTEVISIEQLVSNWREKEEALKIIEDEAKQAKRALETQIFEQGLDEDKLIFPFGSVKIQKTKKANILVDRELFEQQLRKDGIYDRLTSTSLDLKKVIEYSETNDDDFHGTLEVEETKGVRFYARGKNK